MVENGICRPSNSSWSSPIHLVPKSRNEWRICGDYRRLNTVTEPDRYPLPHIQDFSSELHGKVIFRKIALKRAYHQIPVEQSVIPKTAVITPIDIRFIAGSDNFIGDAFSRIGEIQIPNEVDYAAIAEAQRPDKELEELRKNSSLSFKTIEFPGSNLPLYCDVSTGQ
ncbi:hypothetical protein AVEN_55715-1, partial [Araneus ventricosus]